MKNLCDQIDALLAMDEAGALVPHGIGGHARELLTAARAEIARLTDAGAEDFGTFIPPDQITDENLIRPYADLKPASTPPPPVAADRGVPGQDDDRAAAAIYEVMRDGWREDGEDDMPDWHGLLFRFEDEDEEAIDLVGHCRRFARAALATAPKAEDVRREERERLHALMWAHVCAIPVSERAAWVAPMGVVRRGRFLTDAEKLANVEKFLSEDKQAKRIDEFEEWADTATSDLAVEILRWKRAEARLAAMATVTEADAIAFLWFGAATVPRDQENWRPALERTRAALEAFVANKTAGGT